MNQKGEATLFCAMGLLCLVGLFLLAHLSLRKTYRQMQIRTSLFLCVKESKGEIKNYLTFMGQTNWGIKNLNRVSWIAAVIPGLQGVASSAENAKRFLIFTQEMKYVSYMQKWASLKSKGCPLDLRVVTTPYTRNLLSYSRDSEDAAVLKEPKWSYLFIKKPYALGLSFKAEGLEQITPQVHVDSWEIEGKLPSLFSFR